MNKHILANAKNVNDFDRDGFVILPYLEADQLNDLKILANSIDVPQTEKFYSTSFIKDVEFKNKLSQQIIDIVQPQLNKYFSNYKLLGGNFLYKLTGENSEMPIHQDWTVVDEKEYHSMTVWVPLCDTTEQNGALQCIPGSHKWTSALRAPSLPVAFKDAYNILSDCLELKPMKAGEAFIFNHALMHASTPNLSENVRIALTVGLAHKDAALHMYYANGNGEVTRYNMPDDMFLRFPEIRQKPLIGTLSETFKYNVPQLTEEQVRTNLYLYRKNNSSMKPIFKDPKKQTFFENKGYIKIPALNQEQVEKLRILHKDLGIKDEAGHGFYVGMDNENKDLVEKMMDRIIEVALPAVQQHMYDAQVFTASFVVKDPNPKGVVPPHQDWSFVKDEKKHCSITCWIPLVDVSMDNGCIGVIEGSNKFFSQVRPSPSPQTPSPLSKHMFSLFPYLKLVEMKAGEALLFDNRTIHASPPNVTNVPRLAVGLAFTQKEAEITHYYLKPGTKDTMLKYNIDAPFFKKYDNSRLSKMYDEGLYIEDYEVVEELKFVYEDLDTEEMKKRIMGAGNVVNEKLMTRMMDLFSDQMTPNENKSDSASEEVKELTAFQKSFLYRLRPSNLISGFKYYVLNQRA